jgi:hypothetical protein
MRSAPIAPYTIVEKITLPFSAIFRLNGPLFIFGEKNKSSIVIELPNATIRKPRSSDKTSS